MSNLVHESLRLIARILAAHIRNTNLVSAHQPIHLVVLDNIAEEPFDDPAHSSDQRSGRREADPAPGDHRASAEDGNRPSVDAQGSGGEPRPLGSAPAAGGEASGGPVQIVDIQDIIDRDRESAATWFKSPNNGAARAFQDRRKLLEVITGRLAVALPMHPDFGKPPHCPTCQCNKLHTTMPTGPGGAPRSRSWHHDTLLPENDLPEKKDA